MHHQMGIWQFLVDCFDPFNGENIARRRPRKFIGAMARPNGNGKGIATGLGYKSAASSGSVKS